MDKARTTPRIPNSSWEDLMPNNGQKLFNMGFENDSTPLDEEHLNQVMRGIILNKEGIEESNANIESIREDMQETSESIETINTMLGVPSEDESPVYQQLSDIQSALSHLADTDVISSLPSFKFSSSNVGSVEVGTDITPRFEISFDYGKYEYGPEPTGSQASGYEVTFTNDNNSFATNSGTFSPVHVTDSTSLTLSAKCTYTDGDTPKNNLGVDYPEGKIEGGIQTITKTLTGYRQAFAGGLPSNDDATLTAALTPNNKGIRSCGVGTKKSFDIKIAPSTVRVFIAFPSEDWGSLKSVLDANDSNKNIVSAFGYAGIVSVSGATAGKDEMDYKLYVMDFASAYGGSGNTYKVTIG